MTLQLEYLDNAVRQHRVLEEIKRLGDTGDLYPEGESGYKPSIRLHSHYLIYMKGQLGMGVWPHLPRKPGECSVPACC